MDVVEPPNLYGDEKRKIFIVHDESTVYANDATKIVWLENGKNILRPKTNGRSIMVNGFMCSCHGFLVSGGLKSYQLFEAGKAHEGWWTNDDLIKQFVLVAPLFEDHPDHYDCELVFAFDNSQNHHAMAPDALVASRLNLSDGGKSVPLMHDTAYPASFQVGHRRVHRMISQAMQFPDGLQKGIKAILTERGLWRDIPRLNLDCAACSADTPDPTNKACCARRILSEELDFQAQTEWLSDTVTGAGHQIIWFPKFHCELNFIEMVWGYMKASLRRNCAFSFAELKTSMDPTLQNIPLPFIKRVANHCFRFMDGYRLGLTGPMLDYAVKKYKGHRRLPPIPGLKDLIELNFVNYQRIKKEKMMKRK
jgi:hypothetical protein